MSTERQKQYQLITDGYTRAKSKQYDIDIPSEIVTLIFTFYFIRIFHIEHGKKIQVTDNVITNIDSTYAACLNTSVIDEWMDPHSFNNNGYYIHTMKVKIIKQTGFIIVGIVDQNHDLNDAIIAQQGYSLVSDGGYYKCTSLKGNADGYSTGDVVSLMLNIKALSLSYSIIKNGDTEEKKGLLFKAGEINKTKYKWAVGIYDKPDSVEIIDIYSTK